MGGSPRRRAVLVRLLPCFTGGASPQGRPRPTSGDRDAHLLSSYERTCALQLAHSVWLPWRWQPAAIEVQGLASSIRPLAPAVAQSSLRPDTRGGGSSVLQSDGKIVQAGSVLIANNADFVVARLNADGSPDVTFGNQGIVRTPIDVVAGGDDEATAVTVGTNGTILVGGWAEGASQQYQWVIVRYTAAGALDQTFGNGGIGVLDLGGWSNYRNGVRDLVLQPDGKIVAVGITAPYWTALRLTPSGALDSSFGTGGVVRTEPGDLANWAMSVALLPDGRIVAGGFATYLSPPDRFVLVQYLPNGAYDTSFGTNGVVVTPGPADARINDVLRLPDDKLLVAGVQTWSDPAQSLFRLARYLPNGALDTSFGNQGIVLTDFVPGHFAWATATSIALQADDRFVVGGEIRPDEFTPNELILARYTENGTLDASFGDDGWRFYDIVGGPFMFDIGSNVLIQRVDMGSSGFRERLIETGSSSLSQNSGALSAIGVYASTPPLRSGRSGWGSLPLRSTNHADRYELARGLSLLRLRRRSNKRLDVYVEDSAKRAREASACDGFRMRGARELWPVALERMANRGLCSPH